MNGTPRLRSAFPQTPQSGGRQPGTIRGGAIANSPLPDVGSLKERVFQNDGPLIPYDTVDAPQQRLYVVAFYIALLAWRLYDFHYLQEEETESLWMFMKWVAIDGVFLFGLPELRIPWLEWSSATMTILFLAHAFLDGVLMFRIPIPFGAGLVALSKVFYDRELAISERHVKHSSILHNSSLILGKQIINILPDGSATLNPHKQTFCLDPTNSQIYLPIQLNQTTPISIELLHVDLDTNSNQTITISGSHIKKMIREADKQAQSHSPDSPRTLHYPVKATGLYLLQRVLDESKLDVRRARTTDTIVVPCPRAVIAPVSEHKCKGELSNVELAIYGTPPLRVKYRKTINDVEHEASLQSIQPEDFLSPLMQQESDALVLRNRADISWARPQTIRVPLSELLGVSGKWGYVMEEVQDAFGNTISYSQRDHDKQDKTAVRSPHLHQAIRVHERPTAVLSGCDPQHPLRVARGVDADLPVRLGSSGKGGFVDSPYQLEYLFTPDDDVTPAGDDSPTAQRQKAIIANVNQMPRIREPGLYTLHAVSNQYCHGEILQPASCLLQNPQEPSVRIQEEEIFDKCAHKAIGLRVDFHMTGTPPFDIHYTVERPEDGQKSGPHRVRIEGLRGQVELTPPTAGHYKYRFTEVSDATYKGHSLREQKLVLEQDVKPSAHASFINSPQKQEICIDQSVRYQVGLRGEGPFIVEYELVRGNQRKPYKVPNIHGDRLEIDTDILAKGGEYTLSLASVTHNMGCKEFLKEEAKISVRHQKPKAGFGMIEESRSLRSIEGKKLALPVRLSGEAPWTIQYRNVLRPEVELRAQLRNANDRIEVQEEGTFEITTVRDRICPGSVDESANKFDVKWITRPSMRISETSYRERSGDTFFKRDVCQGDEDTVDIHFTGKHGI